jgi:hypothetical protein
LSIINVPTKTSISYQIKDMIGNNITDSKTFIEINNGILKQTLSTNNLAEGVYFVVINIDGKQITKKLVVRK